MSKINLMRATRLLPVFTVAVIAIMTLGGILDSPGVLGAAILGAVALIAFQLGAQYQELRHG